MKKIILSIGGMTCSACSNGLEHHLLKQKGILDATVNLVMATASIDYEDDLTIEEINEYISDAGFKSLGKYDPNIKVKELKKEKQNLIIFTFISIFLMYFMMASHFILPEIIDANKNPIIFTVISLIFAITYIIYGRDIIISGYKNLKHLSPNMDTLVSIGVLSSLIYSLINSFFVIRGDYSKVNNLYYESCCIVIYFIKLGRYIDLNNKDKSKEAIKKLVTITPKNAIIKRNNKEIIVTLDEIKVGDILISKPGSKIAVDGIVKKGETHTDESFITGESKPVKKLPKDKVIAGSLNYDGYIEYEATDIGKKSTISSIVKMVIESTNTKAPIERIADKVSNYFVPTIIIIAILTLIITTIVTKNINTAMNSFVSVLVVACPCALGLATPLGVVIANGIAASNGILIRNSETLENASKVDTIIFDKTGTLTNGKLNLNKIINYKIKSDQEILDIVCSIESKSTHPIATAFNNQKYTKQEIKNYENLEGLGIYCRIKDNEYLVGSSKLLTKYKIKNPNIKDLENLEKNGNTIIYVIENKKVIALIGVKDTIRKEAYSVIKKLQEQNKEVIMLTGDNEQTAQIVANELKISNVYANVLPKDKKELIKEKEKEGKLVMMVGDGINDAPSLALASIGVSLSSGVDVASDSSSVVLMTNNLEKIIDLITISRETTKKIKQNLFWAFFYNICMIPIAIGILKPYNITLNPMLASFAMMLSSITVVLNSLRLKSIKLERDK